MPNTKLRYSSILFCLLCVLTLTVMSVVGCKSSTESSTGATLIWQQIADPNDSTIISFAPSGTTIYALTSAGAVFRSTTDGDAWVNVSPDHIFGIACNGTSIFAAGQQTGVLRSTDNGDTWKLVLGLSNNLTPPTLAANGATIFAGMSKKPYGLSIFRSDDNGDTWAEADSGLSSYQGVVTFGINTNAIFAETYPSSAKLYRSTNNGTAWSQIDTSEPSFYGVTAFTVSGNTVFVARNVNLLTGAIIDRSEDDGSTWVHTAKSPGFYGSDHVSAIAVHGKQIFAAWAPIIYEYADQTLGVYYSQDLGDSWTQSDIGLKDSAVTALGINRTILFAGTQSGKIFRASIP